MTKEELIKRINDLEWEDFEAKEAKGELPKNIWETVSAFANTSGGWIVLGVKEVGKKFEICGVDNQEKLEQDFLGTLRSQKFNVRLSASSFRYDIDGKKVLAFYVPSSALKPIYYGSPVNTFVRMGSGDQRATEMEVMQMYHDQSFGIRSELAIPETRMDMLNMDTLHSYRAYLNADGLLLQCKDMTDEEFCKKLNIMDDNGHLTYAGLIMFGNISVIKRIGDTMTSLGRKIASHTVENYISALTNSYIFYSVPRYDAKGKQLLKTGQKYYLVDIGLRSVINSTKGGDLGHVLENVVYLELARRGGEIYVGKMGDAEIDFVVVQGERKSYYQVSLSVRDEDTMKRELEPLQAIPDNYPKYLLTLDNDPIVFHDGIKQQYVLDWLRQKESI